MTSERSKDEVSLPVLVLPIKELIEQWSCTIKALSDEFFSWEMLLRDFAQKSDVDWEKQIVEIGVILNVLEARLSKIDRELEDKKALSDTERRTRFSEGWKSASTFAYKARSKNFLEK